MKHSRLKRLIFTVIKSEYSCARMSIHEFLKIDYDIIENALQELFKEGKISTPDMWDIVLPTGVKSLHEMRKYRVFYMDKHKRYHSKTYLHKDPAQLFAGKLIEVGYKNVSVEELGDYEVKE